MEGIAGGRGEYAGILADRGFLPASYAQQLLRGGGASDEHRGPGEPDQYSGKCVRQFLFFMLLTGHSGKPIPRAFTTPELPSATQSLPAGGIEHAGFKGAPGFSLHGCSLRA